MPTSNPESGPNLPLALPVPRRTRWYVRSALIIVALGLVVVFGIAIGLNPYDEDGNPRRMATHRQLGIPECNFVTLTGKPCPSCGMTTSFALLVRGDIGASLKANWVGTLLAVFWALLIPWALVSGIRGRSLWIPRGRGEVITTGIVAIFLVLMLARWGVVLLS